jgi:hypothetical protein
MKEEKAKPSKNPPRSESVSSEMENEAPQTLPPSVEGSFQTQEEVLAPTMNPPEEAYTESYGSGDVWHNNKRINAVYSTSGNLNTWASIQDLGWKRFDPSNNTANNAFSIFAGMAKIHGRNVNVRLQGDLITELYIW